MRTGLKLPPGVCSENCSQRKDFKKHGQAFCTVYLLPTSDIPNTCNSVALTPVLNSIQVSVYMRDTYMTYTEKYKRVGKMRLESKLCKTCTFVFFL